MTTNVIIQVPTDAAYAVEVETINESDGSLNSRIYLQPGTRYDYYIYNGLSTTVREVDLSVVAAQYPAAS